MKFEEILADSIVRVMLLNTTDQWGNTVDSPLKTAIAAWASENQQLITDKVVSKLNVDTFSEELAKRVSDSWRPNYEQDRIKKMVEKKIAQKLAEDEIKRLKIRRMGIYQPKRRET